MSNLNWANFVLGNDLKVPVREAGLTRYINFDNAASTPAFKKVTEDVVDYLGWYSNIHRGEGYKSRLSTTIYESCREQVAQFIGLDTRNNTVIFVKNTTEAINKLANYLSFEKQNIVISTFMEHHSNDLPWRKKAKVLYAKTLSDGTLNYEHIEHLCNKYSGKIRLLAVTGASNVTGIVNNIEFLAEQAHKHGAEIMVDGAQLMPHKKINMLPDYHPAHIDYLVFSAHKMYAPFGVGVLAGKKSTFENAVPDYVGGGTISMVSHDRISWAEVPHKEEAGTPNVVGAVALCSSIKMLEEISMTEVEKYEQNLSRYFIKKSADISNIKVYGPLTSDERVGVFSFSVSKEKHGLIAARLSNEYGIGVRNGCFCAHPYVLNLLKVSSKKANMYQKKIQRGNKQGIPGLVRLSLGLYNTYDEIDYFFEALKNIMKSPEESNKYIEDPKTGIFHKN